MKHISSIILAVSLAAAPAAPAVAQTEKDDIRDGMDLLQEGTRLLLEGLMKEIGPALLELEGKIYDLNAYRAPEVLPNGDIIIRRKVPLTPEDQVPKDHVPEGETDL